MLPAPGIEANPPELSAQQLPTSAQSHLRLSLLTAREWHRVSEVWAELANSSPYSSFYLSADWVTTWIESFGDVIRPQIVLFEQGDRAVGVCLLTNAIESRGPFHVRRTYLNMGGEPAPDRTFMEFNNILCLPGFECEIARLLAIHARTLEWNEFVIAGICPGPVLKALQAAGFPDLAAYVAQRESPYVDLDMLRSSRIAYVDSLSPNTRSQLRRSLKRYAANGPLTTEAAADLSTAEAFFEEMCRLHQATWILRGQRGSFGPGRRLEFHRALIRRAWPNRGVDFIRVSCGSQTIGVLYNFLQAGKVYFFQSGFDYNNDGRFKPGLITHACAIQHYLGLGFREYDFLAGDVRYKRSLATSSRPLAWVVFARPSIKLACIEMMRAIKRRLRRK
jgi:hypothetical protein